MYNLTTHAGYGVYRRLHREAVECCESRDGDGCGDRCLVKRFETINQ
jgi:hypothetical protein